MATTRTHVSARLAGAILRGTGVAVSRPVLWGSRRNADRALQEMRHRSRPAPESTPTL